MEQLYDVKEKQLEKITVMIDEATLDDTLVTDLASVVEDNRGHSKLYIQLHTDTQGNLLMVSRQGVDVNRKFLQYLDGNDLRYKVN